MKISNEWPLTPSTNKYQSGILNALSRQCSKLQGLSCNNDMTSIIGNLKQSPPGANLQCTRQSLGCWRDTGNRAIAGGIRFNSLNVDDCMKYAADRGWSVFAVQYNSECFTAPDAEHTYRKYGGANNCAHGRGGGWANSVYKVSCKPGLCSF